MGVEADVEGGRIKEKRERNPVESSGLEHGAGEKQNEEWE